MSINLFIWPLPLDFQRKALEKRKRLYGEYKGPCFANFGKRKKALASVFMSPASENCSSGRGHLSRRETPEKKSIPKGQSIQGLDKEQWPSLLGILELLPISLGTQ